MHGTGGAARGTETPGGLTIRRGAGPSKVLESVYLSLSFSLTIYLLGEAITRDTARRNCARALLARVSGHLNYRRTEIRFSTCTLVLDAVSLSRGIQDELRDDPLIRCSKL